MRVSKYFVLYTYVSLLVAFFLAVFSSLASASTVTVYADYTAWETESSYILVNNFEHGDSCYLNFFDKFDEGTHAKKQFGLYANEEGSHLGFGSQKVWDLNRLIGYAGPEYLEVTLKFSNGGFHQFTVKMGLIDTVLGQVPPKVLRDVANAAWVEVYLLDIWMGHYDLADSPAPFEAFEKCVQAMKDAQS